MYCVLHLIWDAVAKSRKATFGFAMSVLRVPVSIEELPPTWRIFVKFLNLGVLLKSVEKILAWSCTKITGILHEDLRTLRLVWLLALLWLPSLVVGSLVDNNHYWSSQRRQSIRNIKQSVYTHQFIKIKKAKSFGCVKQSSTWFICQKYVKRQIV